MRLKIKRIKPILSLMVSIITVFSLFSLPATANSDYSGNLSETIQSDRGERVSLQETIEAKGKLHFYLGNEEYRDISCLETAQEAYSHMAEMHANMVFNDPRILITVNFNIDYSTTLEYAEFEEERAIVDSHEKELDYRMRLNAASKAYHLREKEKRMYLLSDIVYDEIVDLEYSQSVQLFCYLETIDIEKIYELSLSDEVLSVSVSFEFVTVPTGSFDDTLEEIGAYGIINSGSNTGSGVRVGIYESGGVCVTTHTNLMGKDITLENSSATRTEHATIVTSIVALMAPSAKIYVKSYDTPCLKWFIDNGCSVVNCSFSQRYYYLDQNNNMIFVDEYRNDFDAVFDYQSRIHHITIVVASGNYVNDPDAIGYHPVHTVTTPGLSYNAITVGGVVRTSQNQLVRASAACYESTAPLVKPEVSAIFGVDVPIFGYCQGTSIAAPQVTGSVVLLMSDYGYSLYPERVKTALMANAKKTSNYINNISEFNLEVGAGVIDLYDTINNSYFVYTSLNSSYTAGTEVISIPIWLDQNQKLNAAFASVVWTIPIDPSSPTYCNGPYLTDYDLRVYDNSNSLVASSSLPTTSNVELIRYIAPADDWYRLVVYQFGSHNSYVTSEDISLTYYY